MSNTKKYVEMTKEEMDEIDRQRREQAQEEFRKSVLEVAKAFFAMPEDERKAMIEYVEERRDEAERQAKAAQAKQQAKEKFNFCPECGRKLDADYKFCPECGRCLKKSDKVKVMQNMKNLYLFDCFGVVVTDVSSLWMNGRFSAEEKQYICKHFFRNVDTGKISMREMFTEMSLRYGVTARSIWDIWEDVLKVKWDTIELIRKLKAGGGVVALLSNAAVEYVDYIFDKFDLRKYFDKLFISSRYGVAKPDEEFYRICVDSFDEQFDNIYFTDDNPANLQNIQQLGIQPLLFSSADELEKKLKV